MLCALLNFSSILEIKMNKKLNDYKNFESNEEFHNEEKIEILWSRENKYFSNDFFINGEDSFSDLTDRSNSSCSWHNDDFDMKSSTKVTKSLEAIDDALYEKQFSSFISKDVFQECCKWSDKFHYLRLKGEHISKPLNDHEMLYKFDQKESFTSRDENSTSNLQVEGRKMQLHTFDKFSKKVNLESTSENEPIPFFEEILVSNDDYKDDTISQSKIENTELLQSNEAVTEIEYTLSFNDLQEKVIERLAQHMWPQVLEVLQKSKEIVKTAGKSDENFQLPPIVSAHQDRMRYTPTIRPRTEDSNLQIADFPKLSSFLSVSPKILQDRRECRSGVSSLRSSRPSSEIHLSMQNNALSSSPTKSTSQKAASVLKTPNTPRQVHFVPRKIIRKDEKNEEKISLYLPALEEDISDPIDLLKGFSNQRDSKTTSLVTHFPNKPECFLPPIDINDNLPPDAKLTRNLFTYFGSDLRSSSRKEIKPKTPVSRPNTCASRRGIKSSSNFHCKFFNDTFSTINSSHSDVRRADDNNSEKQVTLFPIVTSLVPTRDKNSTSSKKSFSNSLSGRKR